MSAELARRLAFTLGALLVFRIGSYIPLPGTDIAAWGRITGYHSPDLLFGVVDMPSGGTARQVAIFALGIAPYITAAILMQITSMAWSRLRNLSVAGERGRGKFVAWTLYLTIVLTVFQAYGVAHGLEGVRGLVAHPGLVFELTTVLSLTAGTILLVWLSNQITARGIGNGLVLILAVQLIVDLPAIAAVAWERVRHGILSTDRIAVAVFLAVAITVLIVVVEGARRAIPLDFPRQNPGGGTMESRSSALMLKVNGAGLIPAILAGWLIAILIVGFIVGAGADSAVVPALSHGHLPFMILFGVLVVLLTLFYTAFLTDPDRASDMLKKFGAAVPGIAPGEATASYLDYALARLAFLGAIYLAFVFIVPELLIVYLGVPFYLGGAAFLIIVCAGMDVGTQIRQEVQLTVGGYRR